MNYLEERQDKVMEIWLANPTATLARIAEIAEINPTTFWKYRQDKRFMDEYHKRQQEKFKSLEGKAVAKLEEQMDDGNWNAIKYVLDGSGYKPTDKIEQVTETVIKVSIEDDEEI